MNFMMNYLKFKTPGQLLKRKIQLIKTILKIKYHKQM